MASCFQHINECLYVVKSQLRSHWARFTMQGWHTTFLGMRGLPRDISDFEMKAFFTVDADRKLTHL